MRQAIRRAAAVGAAVLCAALPGCATTAAADDDDEDGDVRRDRADGEADAEGCPEACPPGEHCSRGRCVSDTCPGGCVAGETCCDGMCVDTSTDLDHCGFCGNACVPIGDGCFSGVCSCNGAAACMEGRACCGTMGCLDVLSDPENCGDCGVRCAAGEECLGGSCGGSCLGGCPAVPHGRTACAGESCAISDCDDGWADVDGVVGNGCECAVTPEPPGGNTCDTAVDLGTVSDRSGTLTTDGTILPADDADWFRFTAVDTPDTTCDQFYVDIRFTENPEDQFEFEVFVGDCATPLCAGDVLFSYAADFRDASGREPLGECPCSTTNQPGTNLCSDTGKPFFVKVRRKSVTGGGTCAGYRLSITNGVFSSGP